MHAHACTQLCRVYLLFTLDVMHEIKCAWVQGYVCTLVYMYVTSYQLSVESGGEGEGERNGCHTHKKCAWVKEYVCKVYMYVTSYQLSVATAMVQCPADKTSISTVVLRYIDEHDFFLYYLDVLPDEVFSYCQLSS